MKKFEVNLFITYNRIIYTQNKFKFKAKILFLGQNASKNTAVSLVMAICPTHSIMPYLTTFIDPKRKVLRNIIWPVCLFALERERLRKTLMYNTMYNFYLNSVIKFDQIKPITTFIILKKATWSAIVTVAQAVNSITFLHKKNTASDSLNKQR